MEGRLFCPGGTRPPTEAMITFIEDQRIVYGVSAICRVLLIAPSIARQAIAQQSAKRGYFITASLVVPILPRHQPDTNGMQSCDQ